MSEEVQMAPLNGCEVVLYECHESTYAFENIPIGTKVIVVNGISDAASYRDWLRRSDAEKRIKNIYVSHQGKNYKVLYGEVLMMEESNSESYRVKLTHENGQYYSWYGDKEYFERHYVHSEIDDYAIQKDYCFYEKNTYNKEWRELLMEVGGQNARLGL